VIPVVMSLDRVDKTKKWLLSSKESSNDNYLHNCMHLNSEAWRSRRLPSAKWPAWDMI
jgi:hypothetical protein